jgi:hypothetical protein
MPTELLTNLCQGREYTVDLLSVEHAIKINVEELYLQQI